MFLGFAKDPRQDKSRCRSSREGVEGVDDASERDQNGPVEFCRAKDHSLVTKDPLRVGFVREVEDMPKRCRR